MIDTCINYIEKKNCFYLAKEDKVVYFCSLTGRKVDSKWNKQSLQETLRIIKSTILTVDSNIELGHLICAFQETSRVYEFGTHSRYKVVDGVFNYYEHSDMDIGDEAMRELVSELLKRDLTAIVTTQATDMFNDIKDKLKVDIGAQESRTLQIKHFEIAGYISRTKALRPAIKVNGNNRSKVNALMFPGVKPMSLVMLSDKAMKDIATASYRSIVAGIFA